MKFQIKPLSEIEASASRVAYFFSIIALGLLLFVVTHGARYFWTTLTPFGNGFGIPGEGILVFAGLYLAVIYPLYRTKAIWVLTIAGGLVALPSIPENQIVSFLSHNPWGNYLWIGQMGIIGFVFGLAIWRLRKDITLRWLPLGLIIGVIIFCPLIATANAGISAMIADSLNVAASVLMTRKIARLPHL